MVFLIFFQFCLESGKSFNDANQILMRADGAGVQQKWIGHEIAFSNELPVSVGGVATKKAFVNSVVDHLNALWRNAEQLLNLALGELRDSKDTRRTFQDAPGHLKVQRASQIGMAARPVHVFEHI